MVDKNVKKKYFLCLFIDKKILIFFKKKSDRVTNDKTFGLWVGMINENHLSKKKQIKK